jgi:hypothetical protein
MTSHEIDGEIFDKNTNERPRVFGSDQPTTASQSRKIGFSTTQFYAPPFEMCIW